MDGIIYVFIYFQDRVFSLQIVEWDVEWALIEYIAYYAQMEWCV